MITTRKYIYTHISDGKISLKRHSCKKYAIFYNYFSAKADILNTYVNSL